MAWQLIYTSAEHGLAAGRSGFCTVARHAQIRERLVAELERLSVFDRPPAGHPLPVIRAHRILTVGSERYHILSCIQDAGPDYSGRTNHIAHHLICEEHELGAAATPALVLRQFPWRKRWDKPARHFDESEQVDLSCFHDSAATGSAWEKLTGNPAHSRLLIEATARAGCYIVYAPDDTDRLLLLFHESLSRLAEKIGPFGFWEVAFTTLLQTTDNPSEFAWRGCYTNPGAAAAAAPIFDLTHPGSLPTPPRVDKPKITVQRATTVHERAQPTVAGQRKSRWKRVSPTYDGLSEEEREQILNAQVPPHVLAKQRRRKRIKLLVWCVVLVGLASLFLWLVHSRRLRWTKRGGQETIALTSQHSRVSDATLQPLNELSASATQPARNADTDAYTTIQRPPVTETATTKTESTLKLSELDQLPNLPTYFAVRPSRGHPAPVSQILTGILPAQCHATFVPSMFTNFPSTPGTVSLTITQGEDLVTRFRLANEDVFTIVNGKLTIPSSTATNVLPTTVTIDGYTYKGVVRLEKDSPGEVKMVYSTGIYTFPVEKLPAELQEQFDDRPAIGNKAYNHVALWLGQSQVILLDQHATEVPFPAWHFSANLLDITEDNTKVAVATNLVEQLQKVFPSAYVCLTGNKTNSARWLTSDKTNPTPLVIDLRPAQLALENTIRTLSTSIKASKKDSADCLQTLTSLLNGKLGNGRFLLDGAAVDDKERQTLDKFTPTANEPAALWNEYIAYLRKVLARISSAIPQQNKEVKLDLAETAQPNDLLNFTGTLDKTPAISYDDRLNGFRNAWTNTFDQAALKQAQDALQCGHDLQQVIQIAEAKQKEAQSRLERLPKRVADLKPLRLEIYAGKNWWPLIIFEDKRHDSR